MHTRIPPRVARLKCLILAFVGLLLIPSGGWALDTETLGVEIAGISGDVRKNVEIQLSIYNAAQEQEAGLLESLSLRNKEKKPDLSAAKIKRLHRVAEKEIRQAMQPFGYYAPEVEAKLEQTQGKWQAAYNITPGPPTILEHVEIRVTGPGSEEPSIKAVLPPTTIVPGEKLDHRAYEQTKSQLTDALYNAGYIDARFTRSEIRVYPSRHRADIYLIADSGPQFQFGPVTVEQEILHQAFVDKFATFERGAPFDSSKLIDYQLALTDSNYFSEVEIITKRESASGTEIPITVKTKATKPRRYTAGLGFGTDTGPRFSAGAEFRRINKRGHKIRFDLLASSVEQFFSSQYLVPIKNVASDNLAFRASVSQNHIGDIDTRQFKFGTSINENWRGFRRQLSLTLERENFDIGDGTQTSTLVIPGIQLSRTYADNQLFPRSGYSVQLNIHGGLKSPLTETTFLHTRMSARAVLPLARRGRLLLRTELGAIRAANFSDLPPSQRFFAGGDQSVRGYAYQDLSPKNSDGDAIGGEYLSVASVEVDYLLYKNFGAAMFFDAGNAGNEILTELKKGTGMGLRYRSPVGMIRVDVAHPLDDSSDNFRLHISIGADL
ncbi:MAG: autotransporter assembly complex protein TamA [Geobacteraceae bacterium]|nr:autotransporter assembly complex protein TamA [Geobacteraceae bacterium]